MWKHTNSKFEARNSRQMLISKTLNSKRTVEDGTMCQCHLAQMSKELVRGWRGVYVGRHSVGGHAI